MKWELTVFPVLAPDFLRKFTKDVYKRQTQGVAALAKGRNIDEVINTIKGIDCGGRGTSCPDQLALALIAYKEQQA